MALTLVHYSDVHFPGMLRGWRPGDLFSKKLVGWVNVKFFGRGRRFRFANEIVTALLADIRADLPDAILFSGDATMLALRREYENAAERLGVRDADLPQGFAVPGNHDYYTHMARRGLGFERRAGFEAAFTPWQVGERVDEHYYPFARRVGDVWLIGVNSSYQRFGLGASGRIGSAQMERLRKLCSGLSPGLRIMVTHYPLRDSKGHVERASHRLNDHAAALEAAIECRIALWVHGHIHRPFVLVPGAAIPFPVICAGSATQEHLWSYNRYRIDGVNLSMTRREYDSDAKAFREVETRGMELRTDW